MSWDPRMLGIKVTFLKSEHISKVLENSKLIQNIKKTLIMRIIIPNWSVI